MRSHKRVRRPNLQRVPSDADIADAFRSTFGSKAEIDEMFAGFEAKLRQAFTEDYGRYKRQRDKEWGLAPEGEQPTDEGPAPERSPCPREDRVTQS
jgi:hypothetical protein